MNSQLLHKICMVACVDGFVVDGIFVPREFACAPLTGDRKVQSTKFDLSKMNLTERQIRRLESLFTKQMHGLSVLLHPDECVDFWPFDSDNFVGLLFLYEKARTEEKYLVAHKGCHQLARLLNRLGIPCLDLENYGLTAWEKLRAHDAPNDSPPPASCGWHKNMPASVCPIQKAYRYRRWLERRL